MSDTNADLAKTKTRLEIVEGLLRAIDAGGPLLEAIRSSGDHVEARAVLMAPPWDFSEVLAAHVLDMPYRRTTQLGRSDLADEGVELRRLIATWPNS